MPFYSNPLKVKSSKIIDLSGSPEPEIHVTKKKAKKSLDNRSVTDVFSILDLTSPF
jgi:hypothetical protein